MTLRASLVVLSGMLVWLGYLVVAWLLARAACIHPPAQPVFAALLGLLTVAAVAAELAAVRRVSGRQPPGLWRFAGTGLTVLALAATLWVGLAAWLAPACG